MNYIILDLEWDSAYFKKESRFINQIIQIGAVKLNSDFDIIDTFEVTVKSEISNRVSGRFSRLTGITSDMMRNGASMDRAFKLYNDWSGTDTVTMTWSNSDLYSIIENERYLANGEHFKIEKYLDLQCFVQNEMRLCGIEIKSQISLLNAANIAGITIDSYSLHTAKDDSLISAALLKKYYNEKRFLSLVKDTENPEFFERLCFKSFYINDIEHKDVDKSKLQFFCDECGEKSIRKTEWKFNGHCFVAKFYCKNCNRKFLGRVSFKRTYDNIIVKRSTKNIQTEIKEGKDNDLQSLSEKV